MNNNVIKYAFPHPQYCNDQKGLTDIEFFAAQALQGLLANPEPHVSELALVQRAISIAFFLKKELVVEMKKYEQIAQNNL